MHRKHRPATYGLLAEFESPEALHNAAIRARSEGYSCMDAYTPFPVEGMGAIFGSHRKRVSLITLIGGLAGGLGGYYMQHWMSAVNYPLNVGGRPLESILAFIPVTFEMAVLGAALSAFLGMLALNGLPQPYHPVFNVDQFAMASRDKFFLCIQAIDPKFDQRGTRELLEAMDAHGVFDVPY
ncbi:MAG: DUF3341 domain-containing protein [Acidobacteria bacterium]|nr:DUF3341 domain-containing protein [Acidobacteriota bacterium]